jgi:dCMP deaminase
METIVRLTRDAWAMQMAQLTARRGTCLRRQVGCVLLNARGHVLSTGYNGVAAGMPHCNEPTTPDHPKGWDFVTNPPPKFSHACPGAHAASGTNLDGCHALHAEQNGLLQCRDPWAIDVAYVTASPCMTCTKLLLNTSCQRIVFLEPYPHSEAQVLWETAGRAWEHYQGA